MQLDQRLDRILRGASKLRSLPLLSLLSPDPRRELTQENFLGFYKAQTRALDAAKEIASHITEGWTEKQAASFVNSYLHDTGVKSFFHHAYAWFGERTRFSGINRRMYHQFMPSSRRIKEGEVFILDVAPIVDGFVCDIGYTSSLGENVQLEVAQKFLQDLRAEVPVLFEAKRPGSGIWDVIDQKIRDSGYDNIHKLYPFSVLGHRIYRSGEKHGHLKLLNFGWHSYWSLSSRGLFGQLLNHKFEGDLEGLWAIEPHIGSAGFGAKFEEILVMKDGKAQWLADMELGK